MAEKFWATGMWRILFDGLRTRVRRLHKAIPDQEPEPIQSLDDFIRKTLQIDVPRPLSRATGLTGYAVTLANLSEAYALSNREEDALPASQSSYRFRSRPQATAPRSVGAPRSGQDRRASRPTRCGND